MKAPLEPPIALEGALSHSPSFGFLGTEKECQSFYFFQQKTAPQLSEFFGGDFWERLLLQAALYEPSIRHAILALGSLHAKFDQENDLIMQTNTDRWTNGYSWSYYGKAISILVGALSQKSKQAIDVCLICSILFACIEAMQSSYGSAITHIQSGMKVLCEVKYNERIRRHQHDVLRVSEVPYAPIKLLEEMFMRLDHQITQMVSGQKRKIPTIFSALFKARDSLISHWHVTSYSRSDILDPTSEILPTIPQVGTWQDKYSSILARWSSAYDVYLDIRGDNLTNAKRKGTATLRILKELGATAMMVTRTVIYDERKWDVFCPIFHNVVSLADDIVELDLKSAAEMPLYCVDMALVRPLFEVTCRCRDPIIRRRAILILRKCGRTEGEWNAVATSKVAQRVLNIEEAGLQNIKRCEDVPGWARISNISAAFDPINQRVTLTYSRLRREHDLTRQTTEEVTEMVAYDNS
ncbi:uncharacterized protein TRUGW13939_08154 [Talaromyces rugulosus]|uniref:Uncharacterized protein n=1 Tax=Talaromyces rugulosus TaxID=121627 RepID=A0A7H8R4U2_TALRU|nr:uncharacterized protein TRUGW13939_08154 [Talaromyces rugulosus]QKX61008.1 hypothetical protein TRUGW13939_08154 [Talaromyces rugulosus]